MNLLVLGNGFDLLHGLPTTYKDFIDFTTLFRMLLEKNDITKLDYDARMIDFILHLSPELSDELKSLIKDNLWLIHLEKETIGGAGRILKKRCLKSFKSWMQSELNVIHSLNQDRRSQESMSIWAHLFLISGEIVVLFPLWRLLKN